MSDWYTAAQIQAVTGITPDTLRKWVEREYITRAGRDRYDGDSVIAHWRATYDSEPTRDAAGRFTGRTVHTPVPTCGPTDNPEVDVRD